MRFPDSLLFCGRAPLGWLAACLALGSVPVAAQTGGSAREEQAVLLSIEGGGVEVAPRGTTNWSQAKQNQALNPGDRLRTDKNSRALLRSSRLGQLRVRESSLLTIA